MVQRLLRNESVAQTSHFAKPAGCSLSPCLSFCICMLTGSRSATEAHKSVHLSQLQAVQYDVPASAPLSSIACMLVHQTIRQLTSHIGQCRYMSVSNSNVNGHNNFLCMTSCLESLQRMMCQQQCCTIPVSQDCQKVSARNRRVMEVTPCIK